MCTLYDNIKVLCEEKGVRPSKMCVDIGISKGLISDLKVGRKKSIMIGTAQKIADYFGVSVDRVLGTDQKEKAPANAEAYVNDDPELTEYFEELKNRNEMRMLFKLAKNATKADVMRAVAIIEALRKEDND